MDASESSSAFPITFSIFEAQTERINDTHRDRFEIFAPLTKGETTLKVNGKLVHSGRLGPGMLRLSAPCDREERIVTAPLKALKLSIPVARVNSIFSRYQYDHQPTEHWYMNPLLGGQSLVQRLVSDAVLSSELQEIPRALFLDGITEALIALLIENHRNTLEPAVLTSVRPLPREQMEYCIGYADKRLGQKLSLDAWAQTLHLSTSEFGRRFQRTTGTTPYAWFLERRIEHAQKLLRSTTMSLSALALQLGFASQSHFTETFRRRTGLSPDRWRKSRRDFDMPADIRKILPRSRS